MDVGEALGVAVVGPGVGMEVGVAVGVDVGPAVGLEVGEAVGVAVGAAVGPAVGMVVGKLVGISEGMYTQQPHSPVPHPVGSKKPPFAAKHDALDE